MMRQWRVLHCGDTPVCLVDATMPKSRCVLFCIRTPLVHLSAGASAMAWSVILECLKMTTSPHWKKAGTGTCFSGGDSRLISELDSPPSIFMWQGPADRLDIKSRSGTGLGNPAWGVLLFRFGQRSHRLGDSGPSWLGRRLVRHRLENLVVDFLDVETLESLVGLPIDHRHSRQTLRGRFKREQIGPPK